MEKPEIVYSVFDYWDGPRSGVADFHEKPHFYQGIFDEATDEWLNVFHLSPVAGGVVPLTVEEWQDWYRWKHDFGQGKAVIAARPEIYARYAPIEGMLSQSFTNNLVTAVEAVGNFERFFDPSALPGTAALWRVHWIPLEPADIARLD